MQNLLLFQINDRQFGIRMSFVKKVQNTDAYQTNKAGLIYPQSLLIDGEEIPLYDLNEMFSPQINPVVDLVRQKILLTEDQDRLLAFLIARIDGVVAVSEEQIKRLPLIFNGPARECFPEVLKIKDNVVLLVRPLSIEIQLEKLQDRFVHTPLIDTEACDEKPYVEKNNDKAHETNQSTISEPTPINVSINSDLTCEHGRSVEKKLESMVDSTIFERMLSHSIANIVNSKMKMIFNHAFSEVGTQI